MQSQTASHEIDKFPGNKQPHRAGSSTGWSHHEAATHLAISSHVKERHKQLTPVGFQSEVIGRRSGHAGGCLLAFHRGGDEDAGQRGGCVHHDGDVVSGG